MARETHGDKSGGRSGFVKNAGEFSESQKEFFLSCDTPLDRIIHRPPARFLAAFLKPFPVHPNAITLSSLAPAFAAAACFAHGTGAGGWAGLAGFYLWALLDHADGELARLKGMTSEFGKKLDDVCDTIASSVMLLGIFAGLVERSEAGAPLAWPEFAWAAFGTAILLNAAASELLLRAKRKVRREAVAENRACEIAWQQKILDHFTGREPFYVLIFFVVGALSAGGAWPAWTAGAMIAATAAMAAGSFWARLRMSS